MDHILQIVQFRCIVIFIIGNEPPSILAENEYVHYKKIDFLIRLTILILKGQYLINYAILDYPNMSNLKRC